MVTELNTKKEILAELTALQEKYDLVVKADAPDGVEAEALRAEIEAKKGTIAQYELSTAEMAASIEQLRSELFKASQGTAVDDRVVVVIPYFPDKCNGEDLEIVIESWRKNFAGNLRFNVVGNCKEISLGDDVEVITANQRYLFQILADELEGLPTSFIIAPQNTVLASVCDIHDIALLKCRGEMPVCATSKALKAEGKPTYEYNTNMPMLVHRAHIADALAAMNADLDIVNYAMNRNITRKPYKQVDGDGMYNFSAGNNPNIERAGKALPELKFYNFNTVSFPALKNFLRGYFQMEKKS